MSTGTFDAQKSQNLPEIEKQMAVRCVEHAQTYWNLLEKIKPSTLRLTKLDDEIYQDFQATFPELVESGDPKAVQKINEEAMKSPTGKEKWRTFINKYETKVADFNFGTLIRTDSTDEYTQFNTTFVTRMQFYVYEIARCRRGLNDWVYEKAEKEKAKAAKKQNQSDSTIASLPASANGIGKIAAAIAANLYFLNSSSSSSSRGTYTYANPTLPHNYGSAADFEKAIDDLKAYFSKATGEGWEQHVSQEESELERRGFDENGHRTDSQGMRRSVVCWPRHTEDVVGIVKIANKYKMPLVPFSGGTSLEGHYTAPYAGISVDMSQMDAIVAFHPEDGDMVVQPGIGWETINNFLAEEGHDMFFPLDPAPGATIGGMIGTGCSGTNAVRYGTARGEHWLNMKVVLANGEVIETRGGGRARKSSAGFDLGHILIGAEGTLGIVTEATIKLIPKSPASAVAWTTDVCVPLSALLRLVRETQADLQSVGLEKACIVGHAGDGNFHGLIPFDSADPEESKTTTQAVARMCKCAQDLDGTCTDEHGVGNGKTEFLKRELGEGTLRAMKAVKLCLDPFNLMNPGKLYPK